MFLLSSAFLPSSSGHTFFSEETLTWDGTKAPLCFLSSVGKSLYEDKEQEREGSSGNEKLGEDDSALCNMDVFHLFFSLPPLCFPYLTSSVLPHPWLTTNGAKEVSSFLLFKNPNKKKKREKKESWNKHLTLFRLFNSLLDLRENERKFVCSARESQSLL